MKKILLLLIILFSTQTSFSQDTYLRWAKHISEETGQEVGGRSVTVDNMGNVYTAGIFFGNADLDPGPGVSILSSAGEADIFISKLDANGNFIWGKKIGGILYDYSDKITLDQEGNILITGFFQASVDFDPGPGVFAMTSGGGQDMYILKLNSQGDFLWAKQINTDRNDYGRGIVIDATGNIYITGLFSSSGSVDFDPGPATVLIPPSCQSGLFVLKLDASGNYIWVKVFLGCNSFADGSDLALDGSGNVYLTGNFGGIIDFDPGPATYNITSVSNGIPDDLFLLKLTAAGDFIWIKSIGRGVRPTSITLDNTGNIYITGRYDNPCDFDPGPGTFILTNSAYDCFILKLDNSGNFIWAKSIGGNDGDIGYKIKTDFAGNVYTTGWFEGLTDFDPGTGSFTIQSKGGVDIFLSKLDQNGNFVWAKSIGNTGLDAGLALWLDNFKNIYISGAFEGIVDFDPELTVYNLTAIRYGGFVMKLGQCAFTTSSVLTISVCSSYTLNNQTYSSSGTYTQIIPNSAGCDSIITLNLTINNRYTTINASACDSYIWNSQTYTSSGIYKDTLTASNGCDSIITLNLIINPKSLSTINAAICSGQSYAGYTVAGTYIDTLIAVNGCDSIRTLNLTVKPPSFSTIDTSICSGQNYGGHTTAGVYTDVFIATNGCDSVRTLNLTIKNNCNIYIPNAFTPNKDGLNDLFKPTINMAFQKFSFTIFNRYGEKIFETYEYGKGWDGTFKGKDQQSGTYVYRITFTNASGYESENNGTVLLIR